MADGSTPELYDLSVDPSASHNLADENPDRAARTKAHLLNWNGSMPEDRPARPR
jgi:hypothetical protein